MVSKKKKRGAKKKRYIIPLTIIIVLVAGRLYLPTYVKNYVNKVLADIPGYYGQVEDIDIALYRGAYVINGLYLNKVDAGTQVPFLNFPKNDISIEWKSIIQGKIVSEIKMYSPEVIYVFEDQQTEPGQADADVEDWTKALTDLVPIDINHFEVHDGKVAFVQLQAEPNIDLEVNQIELYMDNLRNVKEQGRVLPSPVRATGVSFGGGNLSIDGNINLIKEIPDMDLALSLENSNASALNDLTSYYAGLDFESGTFELFSEVAIADGYMKGYIKPLLTNTTMIGEEDGFLETLWEGFASFFKFIFKNQGTNTLATRVPIEGDLNKVEAGVWPTVFNIFENAWITAFTGEVDNDIDYEDAFNDPDLTREEKRELRRKRREERREERKSDTTDGFFKRLFDGSEDEDRNETEDETKKIEI